MLVDISRDVLGNQLLIWFLFQEIIIEGYRMLFDEINDKGPNLFDITFLHRHEKELDSIDQTLFAIFSLDVLQVYTKDSLLLVLFWSVRLQTLSLPNSYLQMLIS